MFTKPIEIIEAVDHVPVYLQEETEKSYTGLRVEWLVLFSYIFKNSDDVVKLRMVDLNGIYPIIYGLIKLSDYPELKTLHKNTKLKAKGVIEQVRGHEICLKDLEIDIINEKVSQAHESITRDREKNEKKQYLKKWTTFLGTPNGIITIIAIISIPWWPSWFSFLTNKEVDQTSVNTAVAPVEKISTMTDKLRPLEPLETGKKIGELPNGVYFFAQSSNGIVYEVENSSDDFLSVTNKHYTNSSFELQKIDNRYYLIGFVSDETYSRIGSVNSKNSLFSVVFPNKWGGATHPIAVPFDAIYTIHDREIDLDSNSKMNVLDVGFKEVNDHPETHSN